MAYFAHVTFKMSLTYAPEPYFAYNETFSISFHPHFPVRTFIWYTRRVFGVRMTPDPEHKQILVRKPQFVTLIEEYLTEADD